MATSITLYEDGITETSISISMEVEVTYAANYKVKYGISGYDDDVDETYTSSTFSLSAGGSIDTLWKKFTGLSPGCEYYIWCDLYNADTNTNLGVSDYLILTTDGTKGYILTIKYRDSSTSKTVESEQGEGLTIRTSGLTTRSGWTFAGWTTQTSSTDVEFEGGEEAYAEDGDQTLTLYALYNKSSTVTCYYGLDMASTNTRTKYQWRYNTSSTAYGTSKYTMSPSYLPNISSNVTVNGMSYTGVGWNEDTSASTPDYDAGETLTSSQISGLPSSVYAVYGRTVTIGYNKNGGSGTMSSSTGTAYYNTSGTTKTATISLRSCTFTPPTGKQWKYWATNSSGTGTQYTSSISTSYDNTMYAIWGSAAPDAWAWSEEVTFGGKTYSCPITSGGEVPYYYNATDDVYQVYFMGATEWNEFLDQINELRSYHGLSNYSFTKATAGYQMQASQFNQAVDALNAIQSGVATRVTAGTAVGASSFKKLATAFNSLR